MSLNPNHTVSILSERGRQAVGTESGAKVQHKDVVKGEVAKGIHVLAAQDHGKLSRSFPKGS